MNDAAFLAKIASLEGRIATKDGLLAKMELELAMERRIKGELVLKLAEAQAKLQGLLKRLYGTSSEKLDLLQMELALESMQADAKLELHGPPAPLPKADDKPRRTRGPRQPLPANLPVERIVIEPSAEQMKHPETGEPLVKIREEVFKRIDFRPSQFVIIEEVYPIYGSPVKDCVPVQAAHQKHVIAQSIAGDNLLAYILVSKYADHLPLYRIEQIAARQGVSLDRKLMGQWVEACASLLQPVYRILAQRCMASGYVQCDETPVNVLDPARPTAARTAWLWVRHAPRDKILLFDFDLTRKQSVVLDFFPEDWRGIVQSDGYIAYLTLAATRPGAQHCGCWAHARRHWVEAVDTGNAYVIQVLALIAKLYAVEEEVRHKTPEQREALRQSRSGILLDQLYNLMHQAKASVLPQSGVGKAAEYALSRWPTLIRYAQPGFGFVEIDNNQIENGIRPSALGKKNWLFIGHPEAGWRSAVMYSILGTCKLLKVDPYAYLTWALPKLATATTTTVARLLPHDYLASQTVKEQVPPGAKT
jgi:transposase